MLTEACGILHVLISTHHSRSNGQVERMNELVLQGIRVHCKNMNEWPQLLPAIAASYKAAVIPSRGVSLFQLLYGVNMRLPVETSLSKLLPAHTRSSQNTEILAKQLSLMRQEAQQTAQDSRQCMADAINKTKVTPEFEIGQKVYKVKDVLGDAEDHKTAPKFEGPYVIIDRAPHDVYKLQHFHTGKILKSYVHVDKLKPCGAARAARRERQQISVINCKRDATDGNTDGRAHVCQCQQRKRGRADATRRRTIIHRNTHRKKTTNTTEDEKEFE